MAVTECKKVTRNFGRRATFQSKGRNEYTVFYAIKTDDPNDWMEDVYVGAQTATPDPLPAVYAAYSGDAGAFALRVGLRQPNNDDEQYWIAEVKFGPLPDGDQAGDADENPLRRPVKWWVTDRAEQRPIEKDINGELLRNSAGSEFVDPIVHEFHRPILHAQKNIEDLEDIIGWNLEYDDSINDDKFRGADAKQVLFLPIRAGQPRTENNITYYEAVFSFEYKNEGWDDVVVNQGFMHLDDNDELVRATDPLVEIKDDGTTEIVGQTPTIEPVLLDADGKRFTGPNPGDDQELTFETRQPKDFSVFPLD